jgi:hypothetical protein
MITWVIADINCTITAGRAAVKAIGTIAQGNDQPPGEAEKPDLAQDQRYSQKG